ncbi:MAG: excinuclease ABC subunit UvrA [Anaerolineae bacterium]|jgi:excinuclease ABC subunit A|nr:excinuclease ABC subunit UvrA [Chloroflexota bacterium]
MLQNDIRIRGAREHNLKNIDIDLPRDKLVVLTGLSGSGKSSLAFDTIYAEGQRRYVESLSAYARQFLGLMDKPDLDHIEGLSPAISIDQRSTSRSPRSTVGTVTEIYDYLRLLYARIGVPHCPICGRVITRQSVQQIVDAIDDLPDGTRIMLLAPVIKDRKGEHKRLLDDLQRSGYVRARINGEIVDLDREITLDRYKMHTIEVVVDRLVIRHGAQVDLETHDSDRLRLNDSVETALELGDGILRVLVVDGEELLFSQNYSCPEHGSTMPEVEPRTFSFNSPHGACPDCTGLGFKAELDPRLIVPDQSLSLAEGAVAPWSKAVHSDGYYTRLLEAAAEQYGASMDTPWEQLPEAFQNTLLYGDAGTTVSVRYTNHQGEERTHRTTVEGVIPNLARRYHDTQSDGVRAWIESFMTERLCPTCLGKRLKPESLSVTVDGKNIDEVTQFAIGDCLAFVDELGAKLTEREEIISRQILKELKSRLGFLLDVGLHYLTLARGAASLSGGEAQRIRLATQIGSQLVGVLYVLDEPSIGLHQRDNQKLIETLVRLRDLGNTVLVVEHDEATIQAADYVVDLGPGAGERGGYVVCQGTLDDILACSDSATGQYLSGARAVPVPSKRRPGNGQFLQVRGARANNLKGIDVDIPLGCLVAITGVSGSGKSSLLMEIVEKRLARDLNRAQEHPAEHDAMLGLEYLDKVINIDQSPIGRTPRSNPATYTGMFGPLRELYATLPEAKIRGYKAGRFSFNVRGGRCEACQGAGIIRIEMQFLPDVYVPCEVCHGKRYNREALEIKYRGASIADALDMTVDEALEFFENQPRLFQRLQTLHEVGLGYVRLGQPATTLSGGEAQRVKLARELSRRATGQTFYILDEPTVGLHMADVDRLLRVLSHLVDQGNTVVIIEHNLDVIKSADWVIDLGPDGGARGGELVTTGTPEQVAQCERSFTGQFLRPLLAQAHAEPSQVVAHERV